MSMDDQTETSSCVEVALSKTPTKQCIASAEAEESGILSFYHEGPRTRTRILVEKAKEYLNPGRLFQMVVCYHADLKMKILFLIHAALTVVIWLHFASIKFNEQRMGVPDGAPSYWWKRLVPVVEFGTMHAILYQMALLPLTMSRYSIAALSESIVEHFVPLNRTLKMHIFLGYFMIVAVFLSTCLFFAFFGLMCARGEESFCDNFRSEIMCTGYGIVASLLIIGISSFLRNVIPYEVFYAIHHLVFAMYAITIAHTFDDVERNGGRARSQTFKWFSTSILFYIADRAMMKINHRYRVKLSSSSLIRSSNGGKMVVLRLRRPAVFHFKPGQYAYLKLASIDSHWHPFSVAAGPGSELLEFYVEVRGVGSWTDQLWDLLERHQEHGAGRIDMEIMGPYGTSLGNTDQYSHCLAIGTGTGKTNAVSSVAVMWRGRCLTQDLYGAQHDRNRPHNESVSKARRSAAAPFSGDLFPRALLQHGNGPNT